MNLARLVVGRATQVLVLGQVERALGVLLLQVEVVLEDGLHAFPADGAVLEGARAGRLQPADTVLLPQRQHTQATAERLLRMLPLDQQPLYQHRAARAHGLCPRRQRLRVPAGHLAVRRRHVRGHRRVAALEGALGVAGDALAALEHLDRAARHAHVHLDPGVLARHRVVVAIDLDVVVDADPRHLPFGVFVVLLRQRAQGRLVHLGEGAGAAARQFLEGALVQVGQQRAQRPIQLVEAEEALVAQPRQHPARDHQHAVLDLGFVLGPACARRQDCHAVMLGQVVVGGIDVGLVARGLRDAAAQVVGHPQLGAAAEEGERPHVAANPVRQLLAPGGFNVGVIRRAQNGHEHLGRADFAGAAVGHADALAGVVDEQAFARRVGLPHRCRQLLAPAPVVLAERAVLVRRLHTLRTEER